MVAFDEYNTIGLEDIALSMADESPGGRNDSPKVEIDPHIVKLTRLVNYEPEEDETLCYAWLNISLDAHGWSRDQTKETFWKRIEILCMQCPDLIPSNRIQGSLAHRWFVI